MHYVDPLSRPIRPYIPLQPDNERLLQLDPDLSYIDIFRASNTTFAHLVYKNKPITVVEAPSEQSMRYKLQRLILEQRNTQAQKEIL